MKIAVSGKGGVGKTTVSAALTRIFLEKGFRVFAVDADPDLSLGTMLGFPTDLIHDLKPIVDMRDLIAERAGGTGSFLTLTPDVDDIISDFTIQQGNLRFLKMGAVKKGGSNCYCRENSVLNALIAVLLLREREYAVLDMGAGIEHLTRGTAHGVDLMLIVTEPSLVSINTAGVVRQLAAELGISNIKMIGNKIRSPKDEDFLAARLPVEDILGFVPFSDRVLDEAMEGVFDQFHYLSPALRSITEKIIHG